MNCKYKYSQGAKAGKFCDKNIRNPDNMGFCYAHSPKKQLSNSQYAVKINMGDVEKPKKPLKKDVVKSVKVSTTTKKAPVKSMRKTTKSKPKKLSGG